MHEEHSPAVEVVMLSLLVPVLMLTGGAALVLGAVAVLEGDARPVSPPATATFDLAQLAGGALAHASVTDAGAPPALAAGERAPVDDATAPPTYPEGS